jgi:hypothetical protein
MRKFFFVAGLLLFLGVPAQAAPNEWEHLLIPGSYNAGDAPVHPGTGWFALVPVGGVWRLEPAIVRHAHFDNLIGSEEISSNRKDAIALLRFDGIKGGKVDTPNIKFSNVEQWWEPEIGKPPLKINFKAMEHRLEASLSGFHLKNGSKATSLSDKKFDGKGDDRASLLWAGDLDRDGKLDLLISYGGDNWSGVCLYLSSRAGEGELVREIGCHSGTGC